MGCETNDRQDNSGEISMNGSPGDKQERNHSGKLVPIRVELYPTTPF